MKIANIINVILQSLGLIGTILALFFCYIDEYDGGNGALRCRDDATIIILVCECLFASYQLIHAFIVSILKLVRKEFNWFFGIFWIICLVYLLGWFVILWLNNTEYVGEEITITAILLGWIPILYYFGISIIDLVKRLKT